MESLGQYLRTLREEQQLTPESIRADLKLSLEQITAIESNQLSRLGERGIARAIVHTYVRFLNADTKQAMYLFDQVLPPRSKPGFTPKRPLTEKKFLISTNMIWMLTIALIVIILGSIIWISYSKGYLKRPFDKANSTQIIHKKSAKVKPLPAKPDTLRDRMLELTHNTPKSTPNKDVKTSKHPVKSKDALADTTDYVDGLLFDAQESPFNPRF